MDIQKKLNKFGISPDPMKDQFFLNDEKIIQKVVEFADLREKDVVLEMGAGTGNLTSELAKKAGRVITFEIDESFRPILNNLPGNVEVIWDNAWKHIQMHGKYPHKHVLGYNKVVANPPYSLIEPLLHNLTFIFWDKVILLIPLKFLNKIEDNPLFGSFFKAKKLLAVPKEKFFPVPGSNSVVIELTKLPDPIKTKNLGLFLRQYMYQHEGQLVKNSLMEGIIKYEKLVYSKKVTKNQARKIITKSKIDKNLLERPPDNSEIYELVSKKFSHGIII